MEPTEAQYLILNALETLDFLIQQTFDSDTGNWYIRTSSSVLPLAMVLPSGEVARVNLSQNQPREKDAQLLIIAALETLALLEQRILEPDTGIYYIFTPSELLPLAIILTNGDILPTYWSK